VVAADHAGEALTLGNADHVHVVLFLERVAEDFVARLQLVVAVERYLREVTHRRHAGAVEVPLAGAVRAAVGPRFDQADLDGDVAVLVRSLLLHDQAGSRLDHRDRHEGAVRREDLRHPDFSSENSSNGHGGYFPKALISTSTPTGSSSFISASTV
jgi:hypothetical protein